MSQNQLRDLQNKLACQVDEICYLNEKLNTYNEDMAKKDELQKRFNELQQWVKEIEISRKQKHDEQVNIIDCQHSKLKKSEKIEISLRADNHRLSDINECLEEQSKTLQRNEQRISANIDKLKTSEENLKNELSNVKVSKKGLYIFTGSY